MAGKINLKNYFYDETEIDNLLNGKANVSHNHGNINSVGQITAQIPNNATISGILVDVSGTIFESPTIPYSKLSGTPTIPTSTSQLINDSGFLTEHQSLEGLGGVVTVEQQQTPETNAVATYVVKQDGVQVGSKINIPKDFLVKSASINTVTTANTPEQGFAVGDKYLDFVINTRDNSGTDEHLYLNVNELFNQYSADETTLTLSNGVFSIKSGVIPQGNTTASNIKMNGTQSAGSAATYAKADHVHPVDTSRAAATHLHGSITNDGKIGTASGKPIITGTNGVLETGVFGTSAGQFAEGNHTHSQYLSSADISNKLEASDLSNIIGLSYDASTGELSLTFNTN